MFVSNKNLIRNKVALFKPEIILVVHVSMLEESTCHHFRWVNRPVENDPSSSGSPCHLLSQQRPWRDMSIELDPYQWTQSKAEGSSNFQNGYVNGSGAFLIY